MRDDPKREITIETVFDEFKAFVIDNDVVPFTAVVSAEEKFGMGK